MTNMSFTTTRCMTDAELQAAWEENSTAIAALTETGNQADGGENALQLGRNRRLLARELGRREEGSA